MKGDALADRLPPYNLDAERGVIGSSLLDNGCLHEIVPFLKAGHFYRDTHQVLWQVVLDFYRDGMPIDGLTLAEELSRRKKLESIGGDAALAEILSAVPHAVNALYYARIVHQKAKARDLIDAANAMLADAYGQSRTAEEIVEAAERAVFRISEDDATDSTVPAGVAVQSALDRLARRNRGIAGIGTGLAEVDALTDGFHPEQVVILAARPSMGKTALALNILEWVGLQLGECCLLVSLEMNRTDLGERLLCARSAVPNWKLKKTDHLRPEEHRALVDAAEEIERSPIQIDDTPARTTMQILANARRFKARSNLKLLIVDYLGLVTPGAGQSRQEQVAQVSRDLKLIARDLKIPVVCLSQLNRQPEGRTDKRPVMSDLRDSGGIEQDADVVMLLHRPDYYDASDEPGLAELIVAKNRNGQTGTIDLRFLKETGRFECWPDRRRHRDAAIDPPGPADIDPAYPRITPGDPDRPF